MIFMQVFDLWVPHAVIQNDWQGVQSLLGYVEQNFIIWYTDELKTEQWRGIEIYDSKYRASITLESTTM